MRRLSRYSALVILAAAGGAFAQADDGFSDRIELRALRQDAAVPMAMFKIADAPEVQWTGTLGASFVDGQNGSEAFSTPFALKAGFGKSTVRIASDYQNVDAGDRTKSGFGDVLLAATHRFYEKLDPRFPPQDGKKHKLVAEVGVFVPTAGEVGGSHARQRVGLSYGGPLTDRFGLGTKVQFTRRNGDLPSDQSRLTRTGAADLGYTIEPDVNEVSVSLSRSHRSGAGGATKVTAAYAHKLKTKQQVSVGYVHGLTQGAKDKGVEASLTWPF